jgi:hypothetical protein
MRSGRPLAGAYQDWTDWLEAYGQGQDRPTGHLVPVSDELGPDFQSRLITRITTAFQCRLDRWCDVFSRDLRAANTTTGYAAAMVSAKQRLTALRGFTGSPLLPQGIREALATALSGAVDQLQQSLVETAQRNGPQLMAVVRDHDLRRQPPPSSNPSTPPNPTAAPPPAPGRRVIR